MNDTTQKTIITNAFFAPFLFFATMVASFEFGNWVSRLGTALMQDTPGILEQEKQRRFANAILHAPNDATKKIICETLIADVVDEDGKREENDTRPILLMRAAYKDCDRVGAEYPKMTREQIQQEVK